MSTLPTSSRPSGYARTNDLGVSVRSGGHHVAGSAVIDGGLVIDLGGLRDVTVDGATGGCTPPVAP